MGVRLLTFNYGNMILPFTIKINAKAPIVQDGFHFDIDTELYPLAVPNSCQSALFINPEWQTVPKEESVVMNLPDFSEPVTLEGKWMPIDFIVITNYTVKTSTIDGRQSVEVDKILHE